MMFMICDSLIIRFETHPRHSTITEYQYCFGFLCTFYSAVVFNFLCLAPKDNKR